MKKKRVLTACHEAGIWKSLRARLTDEVFEQVTDPLLFVRLDKRIRIPTWLAIRKLPRSRK